jgi:hypothetical protein
MINAMPAFAVPLTRILSPVIAVCEIVVRSALIVLLVSWTLLGSLLAEAVPAPCLRFLY